MANKVPHTENPPATLPVELWELICTFLPDEEICRLYNFNRIFHAKAIDLLYGSIDIPGGTPFLRHQLNAISRYHHIADRVHSLSVTSAAPLFLELSRQQFGIFQYIILSLISSTFRHGLVVHHIRKALSHLHHIRSLRICYLTDTYAHMDMAWKMCSQTLVELDLKLVHGGTQQFAGLASSVVCPRVRVLSVSISPQRHFNSGYSIGFASEVNRAIERINSLIPHSTLEELTIMIWAFRAWDPVDIRNPTLPFFRFSHLKKLKVFTPKVATEYPIDIISLTEINTSTLQDLKLSHTLLIPYQNLTWNTQIHHLFMGGEAFYKNHSALLPRLAQCTALKSFKLGGRDLSWITTQHDIQQFLDDIIHCLSESESDSLRILHLPSVDFNASFTTNILGLFPRLTELVLVGLTDRAYQLFQEYVDMDMNRPHFVIGRKSEY